MPPMKFTCPLRPALVSLALLAGVTFGSGCASNALGQRFPDPISTLKIGHDTENDVVTKLGSPFRRTLDTQGRTVLTFLWADGDGAGTSCIVALNQDGVVALVDVAR
jgi:hypothetical protein